MSFGEALVAAYEEVESKPDCGTIYENDCVPGVRAIKLATQHMLCFAVIDQPPQPYILFVGIKGATEPA